MRNLSGIYLIKCCRPGERSIYYVGQSSDMPRRRQEHFGDLRRGDHYNAHMQRACNKYGLPAFSFRVLETCSPDLLTAREQFWLDKMFGRARCMNLALCADSPGRGIKRSPESIRLMSKAKTGIRHSEETRQLLSRIQLGKKRGPHSEEVKRKIGDAQKGAKNHSFGKRGGAHHRSKAVEGTCVETGAVIRFESSQLAKDAGFSQSAISSVCRGKWSTHKGYKWRFVI